MAVEKELVEAIEQITQGEKQGFNTLYSHTYNYVYGRARFIMKNEEDALDLVQETYVHAYKGLETLDDVNNIYAWLGAIVYRQGMMIFRKKKELLLDEEAEGIFDDIVSEDMDTAPEDSMQAKETSKIVMDMIDELPELQKAAVIAFYYDNMKIDDIAKVYDCSSNTIKSRLNYAKKYLRDKVEEHEKKNGYKLHSVSPFIILLALKELLAGGKYNMTQAVAKDTYVSVCGAVGLETTELVTSAVASTVAKTGLSIGAKIAMGITGIAVAGGIAAGVVLGTGSEDRKDKEDNDKEVVSEMVYETSSDKPSVMITPDGEEIILDDNPPVGMDFDEAFEMWDGVWCSKSEYGVDAISFSLNKDGSCTVNGEECVWDQNTYEEVADFVTMSATITLEDENEYSIDMYINTLEDGKKTARATCTTKNGETFDMYSEENYIDKLNGFMGTWQSDYNNENIDEVQLNADNTCTIGENAGKWNVNAVLDVENDGVADGLVFDIKCDSGDVYIIYAYWNETRTCDMWISIPNESAEEMVGFMLSPNSTYEVVNIDMNNWQEYFEIVELPVFLSDSVDTPSFSLHQRFYLKEEYRERILNEYSSLSFTVNQKIYSQQITIDFENKTYTLGDIILEQGNNKMEESPVGSMADENGEYVLISTGYSIGSGIVLATDTNAIQCTMFESFENIEGELVFR